MPHSHSLNAEESLVARAQCVKVGGRFWGKIFAQDADYYILAVGAVGEQAQEFYYYTLSMIEEGQDAAKLVTASKQPDGLSNMYLFTGNPDTELVAEQEATTEDEGKFSEGAAAYLEHHHLAYTVTKIFEAVNFTPRGYITRNIVSGELRRGNYAGLTASEASQLSSYWFPNAGPPTGGIKTLEDVKPRAAWSIVSQRNEGWVIVRSLVYVGFEFGLELGTPNFSAQYFGNGQRNNDIAFML